MFGQEVLLQSPLTNDDGELMPTDFQTGPKVRVVRINPIRGGDASIFLTLQIYTSVGCPDALYMLANRWQWHVEHDPDSFTAIHVIDGEAVFRLDKLLNDVVSPDQLRSQWLLPIPNGFRRDPPSITVLPAGNAVRYQIVDRQQILNLPGAQQYACTRIEIEQARTYTASVQVQVPRGVGSGFIGGALGGGAVGSFASGFLGGLFGGK
jgi:hypothetical protein